jgi:hypothetical protein
MPTVDTMIMIPMNTKLGKSEQKMKKATPKEIITIPVATGLNIDDHVKIMPCMLNSFIQITQKKLALMNKLRLYILDSI